MKKLLDDLEAPRMVTLAKQCRKHKTFFKQVRGFGRVFASYCPECSREEEQRELRREQEERRERKQQQIREELRLKVGRNWDFPLAAFGMSKEQTNLLRRATDFNDLQRGFYFQGRQGLGKTLLAKIITRKIASQGRSYLFKTLSQINYELEATRIGGRLKYLNHYQQLDFLVIDDLGRHSTTSNLLKDFLFNLINFRLEENIAVTKTIITSNLTIADLGGLNFFETDRLGTCQVLQFTGNSKRSTEGRVPPTPHVSHKKR